MWFSDAKRTIVYSYMRNFYTSFMRLGMGVENGMGLGRRHHRSEAGRSQTSLLHFTLIRLPKKLFGISAYSLRRLRRTADCSLCILHVLSNPSLTQVGTWGGRSSPYPTYLPTYRPKGLCNEPVWTPPMPAFVLLGSEFDVNVEFLSFISPLKRDPVTLCTWVR